MHSGGLAQGLQRSTLSRRERSRQLASTSVVQRSMHALESNLVEERQAAQKLMFTVFNSVLPPLAAAQCLLLVTRLRCTIQKLLMAVLTS